MQGRPQRAYSATNAFVLLPAQSCPTAVPLLLGMSPNRMGTPNHALRLHRDPYSHVVMAARCEYALLWGRFNQRPHCPAPQQPSALNAACLPRCPGMKSNALPTSTRFWQQLPRWGRPDLALVSVSVTCRLFFESEGNSLCIWYSPQRCTSNYFTSLYLVVILPELFSPSIRFVLRRVSTASFCNTTPDLINRAEALTFGIRCLRSTSDEESSPTLIMR